MGILIAVLQVAGIAAVVVGVIMVSLPAGIIVAGVLTFAYGLLLEARWSREEEPAEE